MTDVVWKIADEQRDARKLEAFTCALQHPPRNKSLVWELEVQKYFRKGVWADTNASRHLGQSFRIAEDPDGIAAAYTHSRLADQPPEFVPPARSQTRLLVMLGIAVRYRRQGGKFADEVLLNALYDIQDCEPESHEINVLAKVHMGNIPSQNMLERAEFQQGVPGTPARPYGWWYLILRR